MIEKFIEVPLGGNSFLTNKPQSAEDNITPEGWEHWTSSNDIYSIFYKPSVDAASQLSLTIDAAKFDAEISATVGGIEKIAMIKKGDTVVNLGTWDTKAGYVRVDIRGIKKSGKTFAFPHSLIVTGVSDEEMASYARLSDKQDFYWIRRGPSVHCQYDLSPVGDDVEWFYNEVTVQPGEDPHGTYGMAVGFNGGYYGIQVCDNGIRKVLFSIWSPYSTDHPEEIPEEKMVHVLGKHTNVHTGEFGGEGSGGQSFMDYDWKSGMTYKMLVHIVPVGNNKSEYTSYFFFPESGKWELFCSFLRPETNSYFKGPYSFLESFIDTNGFNFRKVRFSNQWAVSKAGKWFPINTMRLTGDVTARKAQRQDYGGGIEDDHFYLNNCGFFSKNDTLDTKFTIDASKYHRPDIDLGALEKVR